MAKAETIDANDEEAVLAAAREIDARREREAREALEAETVAARAKTVATYAPVVAFVDGDAFAALRAEVIALRETANLPRVLVNAIDAVPGLLDVIASLVPGDARPTAN